MAENSQLKRPSEKDFSIENYEGFYEHHAFEALPESTCLIVDEYIPRFGWGMERLRELKPKRILDIGCLDGSFVLSAVNQIGCVGTGLDLTVEGTDLATARAKKLNINATFHQTAAEDWLEDYDGPKFDVVTFFEIIEHVKDVQKLLKLIDKVLAPGGTVLCSTPAFESPEYGADDEQNKCHIRLYTMEDEDYEKVNKYGTLRKATSITKEIGKDRIKDMATYSHLINVEYK